MADRLSKRRKATERNVLEGRRVVERQRKIVAAHERRGTNSSDARSLLAQFERTLMAFENDLKNIMKEQDT